jgi:hypothetical protein
VATVDITPVGDIAGLVVEAPQSRRILIVKAIAATLGRANAVAGAVEFAKPAGLDVHRHLSRPIESEKFPAVVVGVAGSDEEAASEQIVRGPGGALLRTLLVDVMIRCVGKVPEDACDPYLTWAEVAVAEDPTLGGLCEDVVPILVGFLGVRGAKADISLAMIRLEVKYTTRMNNPTLA